MEIPDEWLAPKKDGNSSQSSGGSSSRKRAAADHAPSSSSSTSNKRGATTVKNAGDAPEPPPPVIVSHHHHQHEVPPSSGNKACGRPLRDEVAKALARDSTQAAEELLEVDSLLCRLPYKRMLASFCTNAALEAAGVPYVTRAYEEAFMHEVVSKEQRECARGKLCECMFIDKENPFICVEFLLPGEKPPPMPNLCVLCSRATTQQLYYDIMYDRAEFGGVIQRFGNLHSQEGEYALDAMLIASPSAPAHVMPLPIVSHQRNRYQVTVNGGVRYLRQQRVYFQTTPSCSAGNGS